MPDPNAPTPAQLQARILALEKKCHQLAEGLAEEDHQARRQRDVLERAGGRAPAVEQSLSLLDEGRRMTRQALEQTNRELAAARAEEGRLKRSTPTP